MIRRIIAVSILCCVTSFAAEGESFLCITDKVTGFDYDKDTGSWERASFLPGERFLITSLEGDRYVVEKVDETRPWSAECRRRDDVPGDSYSCENGTNSIHFNRKERRFTAFRYFGYWTGSGDSLSIAIGSCAPG